MILHSKRLIDRDTASTNLRWTVDGGFGLMTVDRKSGHRNILPLAPEDMDVIAREWPTFRDKILSAADAPNAAPATPSPPTGRDGRGAISSNSSPPPSGRHSTTAGSGGPSSASGRDSGVASSPEEQKTLL
jgi:hypothetical protein